MAVTRGSTGHSAPHQAYHPEPSTTTSNNTKKVKKRVARPKKAVTPRSATSGSGRPKAKPKANTSAPRASGATKTGRVTKKTPAKTQKRTPTAKAKIEGLTEKGVGAVTGKPGKKAAGTRKMRGTNGKGGTKKKAAA